MIHDLVGVEDRNRREHAKCIGGEKDDGLWMRALGSFSNTGVAAERVGEAGVLGDRAIGEVEVVGVGLFDRLANEWRHVLDECALHRHRRSNDGFGRLVQVDELGVAAVFEVRHARVRPDVLVVADEQTVRVGRKGGLSGAREPEENR